MRISDWSSDVCSSDLGRAAHRLTDWEAEERVTRWTNAGDGRWTCELGAIAEWEAHPADIYSAMIVSLRDYVDRNRFPGVVPGLSGGIDSATCAAIAADAERKGVVSGKGASVRVDSVGRRILKKKIKHTKR